MKRKAALPARKRRLPAGPEIMIKKFITKKQGETSERSSWRRNASFRIYPQSQYSETYQALHNYQQPRPEAEPQVRRDINPSIQIISSGSLVFKAPLC
jgi:hypothetical protein